ncbi:hypothetical protein BS50DRAFT_618935 [Corynespora cassiicola Philippines]|uniref:Sensor histidine kinase-like protein/response regulator n=1 Tax=Corynespora cassiicola Philippines TaxID=1448308 RepID=A0A2T2NX43_CORCC|nr:hypothetical protein BS50DRAFT_618935 [Corynespora cassiicola Philippines]
MPPRPPRSFSESKREQDVRRLYGLAFRDIPYIPDASTTLRDHVAKAGKDKSLMAFAQLASIRLQTCRAMISLIDGERQHILAEATPTYSLRTISENTVDDRLCLGYVSIPRRMGVCEKVLALNTSRSASPEEGAVVIHDLAEDEKYPNLAQFDEFPRPRFYAGVALTTPRGVIVGALCVFDDKPRQGIPVEQIVYLQDIAATIMEYLDTLAIKEVHGRGEKMVHGMITFAQGDSTPNNSCENEISVQMQGSSLSACSTPEPEEFREKSNDREDPLIKLQKSAFPKSFRDMFSRAASILRVASDLDGVLILDASAVSRDENRLNGSLPQNYSENSQDTRSSSDGEQSGTPRTFGAPQSHTTRACQILGAASQAGMGPNQFYELILRKLLQKFPEGEVFNFDTNGEIITSGDDSESASSEGWLQRRSSSFGYARGVAEAIHVALPGSRSVAFVPFWDFERSRWFAGCLCWSNRADRILSRQHDLPIFKVFSHSIMYELGQLDSKAASQAKQTFLSSISHELRSPLHGILGSIQFLQDTSLDSFQLSMLDSMAASGQTLLQTLDNVLDYSTTSEVHRQLSTRKLKGENTIRLSARTSKSLRVNLLTEDPVDLGISTEEVAEAVFSGQTYQEFIHSSSGEAPSSRKTRFIILDIADGQDWDFCIPSGMFRRIIMNLLGNAMKFTPIGHIKISLQSGKEKSGLTPVTLTVTDTGSAICPDFLANKAFQPFSQEDPLSTGTGVGLSIVRHIVEIIGGNIEMTSNKDVGTQVSVKMPLIRDDREQKKPYPKRDRLNRILRRLSGKKIAIVHKDHSSEVDAISQVFSLQSQQEFTSALAYTLRSWLKMEVIETTGWGHTADLVICPEVSLDYLTAMRSQRPPGSKAPAMIFIAMDGLEAATLRSFPKVTNTESVVEITTQPCGPYKLAYLLNHCLDRYESPTENTPSESGPLVAPLSVGMQKITPYSHEMEDSSIPSSPTNTKPALIKWNYSSAESNTESQQDPPRVLIADDNAINRRLLGAFMKREKILYAEVVNGLQALEKYQENSTAFSVILMDISMPLMDGLTATRRIRRHEKRMNMKPCRIIALTGLTSASTRLEALTSGVDSFMTKPVNFRELKEMMFRKEGGTADGNTQETTT